MDVNTNTYKAILAAHRKGYLVLSTGDVESPHGKLRKLTVQSRKGRPYLRFNLKVSPEIGVYPVFVHQLAAFQKFGESAFASAACVRHLNDDSTDNRPDNIALGSIHDNIMDRPAAERQDHARKASKTLARKDWDVIDADRERGLSYRDLESKYGVSRGTLSYRYSKTGVRCRKQAQ